MLLEGLDESIGARVAFLKLVSAKLSRFCDRGEKILFRIDEEFLLSRDRAMALVPMWVAEYDISFGRPL